MGISSNLGVQSPTGMRMFHDIWYTSRYAPFSAGEWMYHNIWYTYRGTQRCIPFGDIVNGVFEAAALMVSVLSSFFLTVL